MAQSTRKTLEVLVVDHNARARITYQLAQQLAPYLPIKSLDNLKGVAGEIVVDGHTLPIDSLSSFITSDLFPIADLEGLVFRLSTAVRIASALIAQPTAGWPAGPTLTTLLGAAEVPGSKSPMPSGHFAGKSAFGFTPSSAATQRTWVVTLQITDCSTDEALPYCFISDGSSTYFSNVYGQFIAVIGDDIEVLVLLIQRNGYISRTIALDRSQSGTTVTTCLNPP